MARWYRAYPGTVGHENIAEAAMVSGASRSVVVATWHAILESCATVNDGGRFDTSPRRVAAVLCEPLPLICAVFAALSDVGMISGDMATKWRERQYETETSTQRVRAFRERQRNGEETRGNADETHETVKTVPETPPEYRVQNTELTANAVSTPLPPTDETSEAVQAWNRLATDLGLPRVQRLTEPRKRALRARLAECGGLEGWETALAKIRGSPFLRGEGRDGWRADFDFVCQPKSFTKLMEGAYDDRKSGAGRPSAHIAAGLAALSERGWGLAGEDAPRDEAPNGRGFDFDLAPVADAG